MLTSEIEKNGSFFYYYNNSLQCLGVLLGTADYVSARPAARRNKTFRSRWAVPRMADNCTVPMNSVTPSLLYQVLARHASKSTSHDRYYRDFRGYMSPSDFKCRLLVLFHLVLLGAYGFLVSLNSYVKTCPFACIFMQLSNPVRLPCLCR